MRNLLFKLALVLLVAASFTSFSQPYSFVKSHDTGARYVKLTSSDDTLFAISESNYIDLYNLNEFEQKKPRKRLEFDRVVTDAVYSEGHLLVGFDSHLDLYQLDNNDNAVLKKRLPFEIHQAHHALYAAGDYVAISRAVKVELLKWSNGALTAVTAISQPAPSYYSTGLAIDTDQLVIKWFSGNDSRSIVQTYDLATGSMQNTEFNGPYTQILLSTTELIAFDSTGTLNWHEFQNNEWQFKAARKYAFGGINYNQWFKSDNRLFAINMYYIEQNKIIEYRLENGAITESLLSFGSNRYCNNVITLTKNYYCLMDDRVSLVEISNSAPQITKNLALFTPESEALSSDDTQLFQLSAHQLRSTSLQQPDLFNSTASLAIQQGFYHLNTFRDRVLVNNGQTYINLKNQDSGFSITEQITDSDLQWAYNPKNWFAPNTLIGIANKLQRLHFYNTDTERFLLTPPVILSWDKIKLPGEEQISEVREVHYRNNWLVLRLNTTNNIASIYAVPLDPSTYQPLAQAQLLTDESGRPLWSDEIHSDGSSLILHTTQHAYRLVLLEIGNTQIKHKNSYDLTPYPNCRGAFTKLSNNLLMMNTSNPDIKESGYCLFEHKAGELTYIQELSAPGHFRAQMGFTFAHFGSTLVAATNEDGRTTFYQKNYAPQSQLVLTEIAEDSKDQLVVQSIDAENDSIQLQLLEQPEHGEISVTDHQLFYTPDADFSGVDQWLLRSSDVHGNFTETRHQLTVTPVNDAPKLQAPAHFNLKEDSQLTVQLAATDAEQQQISFQLLDAPQFGTATVSATGLLNYNPAENLFGQDQLELQLTDSEGASRVETISLQIEPVNDLPQLQQLSLNGMEDQVLVAALPVMDPDSEVASITLVEAPLNGSATFSGTTLTYQPKPDFNGTEQLKLRLNDSAGGSTETSLSLEIEAVNDAPLYHGTRHYQLDEDNLLKVTLVAQDKENQSVQFKLLSPATLGVAQLSPAGELSYNPHSNLSGEEKLQIQLTDSEQASTNLELSISIRAVNDLPQLRQFSFSVAEDAELSVTLEVTDADSTPGSIELIQNASHGQATLTGQRLQYKATANYQGQDKIRLRLNDSAGGYAEVDLLLQVTAVNDSPVLAAQSLTMNTGTSRSLQLAATDAENDTLSYTLQSTANLGTATLSSTGLLSYTATAAGTENLTVEVKDPSGAAAQANISIVITTPPAPPAESSSGGGLGWPAFVLLLLCYSRRRSARY